MKIMKRITCWWHGHEHNPYDPGSCLRCGEQHDYEFGFRDRIMRRVRHPMWRLRKWIGKCPDCGKRFNRHDSSCPPF
jgi:hypothetical protein